MIFFVGVMRPWQKIVLVTTITRGTHYLMVNSEFFVVFLNKSSNTPKSHKLLSTYMFEMYKPFFFIYFIVFFSNVYCFQSICLLFFFRQFSYY